MSHLPVIDGLEFARSGSKLEGAWPVAGFARLRDLLRSDSGVLGYELLGIAQDQGRPGLRLRVHGALQLVCQRCLDTLEYPLHIDTLLQLAATQAEVDAAPLDAEGPEQIVAAREMPVHELVEDEVLLALPIAPRHERCAARQAPAAGAEASPFARLRGLVGGAKH